MIIGLKALFKQPQRIQFPAAVVDIKPTILAMIGATKSYQQQTDGRSLLPLMQNSSSSSLKPKYRYIHEGLYIKLNPDATVADKDISAAIKVFDYDKFGQPFHPKKDYISFANAH